MGIERRGEGKPDRRRRQGGTGAPRQKTRAIRTVEGLEEEWIAQGLQELEPKMEENGALN